MLSLEGKIKSYSHLKLLRDWKRMREFFLKKIETRFLVQREYLLNLVVCRVLEYCRFYDSLGSRICKHKTAQSVELHIWEIIAEAVKKILILDGSCSMNFIVASTAEQGKKTLYREYKYMQIWCVVIKMIILRVLKKSRETSCHFCCDVACEKNDDQSHITYRLEKACSRDN